MELSKDIMVQFKQVRGTGGEISKNIRLTLVFENTYTHTVLPPLFISNFTIKYLLIQSADYFLDSLLNCDFNRLILSDQLSKRISKVSHKNKRH